MTAHATSELVDLLRAALRDEPPKFVGGYEILDPIGKGGMGVVYLARCQHSGLLVALKMIQSEIVMGEGALRLFKREIRATAAAQHPNIVPLFSVGDHEGQLYYTMKRLESSLAQRLKHFSSPRTAAALIQVVARAVQHLHEQFFLHLDLKPENVLLDTNGHPYIADFGLARFAKGGSLGNSIESIGSASLKVLAHSSTRSTGAAGGTYFYMSPEQRNRGGRVTAASDIYSLGAILYELLCSDPKNAFEPLAEPTFLDRFFRPDLEGDLAAICRKCLELDPQRRYRFAADLADDLGRALRREPTQARPLPRWRLLLRISIRHPLLSFGLATLLCLAPVATAGGLAILSRWTQEQVKGVLLSNGLAAKFAAGWILNQLEETMSEVVRIASDPMIAALAAGPPLDDAQMLQRYQEAGFGIVAVYNRDGIITAIWPEGPSNILGRDYAWRDYFRGACQAGENHAGGAYVARAFQSENDGDYNLSISAPILENGKCVGLVLASVLTDSSLGPVRLVGQDNPRQKGVLVGPQDRSRGADSGSFPRNYLLLIHDALQPAQGIDVPDDGALADLEIRFGAPQPRGQQLQLPDVVPLTTDSYRDPLDPEYRWLAAFYPVGGTGLVVGVQTRYDLVERITGFAGLALLWVVGAGAIAVAMLMLTLRVVRLRTARISTADE